VTQRDSGEYRWHLSVGTVSIVAVGLIWLPTALRFLILVGGSVKAGGVEATAGGLLSSPDELIDDLANLRTKTESIGTQQPDTRPSLQSLDSAIDMMAIRYLPSDGVLSQPLLSQKARDYEAIRNTMASGAARTKAMSTLVNDVRIRAAAAPPARQYAGQFLTSARPGDRIVGLGLIEGAPSADNFTDILQMFSSSVSAFEQYHSLRALSLIGPALDANQRNQAIQALEAEKDDPRHVGVMKDTNLPTWIEHVLAVLRGDQKVL
jgi:hypothetical protein